MFFGICLSDVVDVCYDGLFNYFFDDFVFEGYCEVKFEFVGVMVYVFCYDISDG